MSSLCLSQWSCIVYSCFSLSGVTSFFVFQNKKFWMFWFFPGVDKNFLQDLKVVSHFQFSAFCQEKIQKLFLSWHSLLLFSSWFFSAIDNTVASFKDIPKSPTWVGRTIVLFGFKIFIQIEILFYRRNANAF